MGTVRADIWRRYGALGTVGKSANDVRKDISAARLYADLRVDGTIRNETTKDIVNDQSASASTTGGAPWRFLVEIPGIRIGEEAKQMGAVRILCLIGDAA
ncbi:MAG TPA: hypothetical protein VMV40_07375 [Acidiferrobacter sp.]|nr:hypothetical protein [Acidiferrobacter sp.]